VNSKNDVMSRGFVKEYEDQWLNEIPPTMGALVRFLTQESNGIPIYEKKLYTDPVTAKSVHEMSNGLSYYLDDEGKWALID
jgi:hypothetical protein